MSDNQLNFDKWTTLLEPKPSDLPKAKPATEESLRPPEPPPEPVQAVDVEPEVLSVSDLNGLIKEQLEGNFKSVWIRGEISNFKAHTSGHHYFSLKDDRSQINAVMFKGFNGRLKFRPENGMEVVVRGRVTVYEPRGNYQIFCETMEPVGAGALQKAFEQLKAKLQAEGLFDVKIKKPLPTLPKSIGVVTSPTGAAIQDILNVLGRRYRAAHVTVIPARVQGEGAAQEIVRGIQLANKVGGFDVLIVGRGGGSMEDMWCFNEEGVARAIFASQIPIISAVGHEIDFTIADFVADYRAPTPSAAAEVVAQSAAELSERVLNAEKRLQRVLQFRLSHWLIQVNMWQSRLVDPQRRLLDLSQRCDEITQRLQSAFLARLNEWKLQTRILRERLKNPQSTIQLKKQKVHHARSVLERQAQIFLRRRQDRLEGQIAVLDSLSPLKVMGRGYSVVFRGEEVVKSEDQVKVGEKLSVQLPQGGLSVSVLGAEPDRFQKLKEESWTSKKN